MQVAYINLLDFVTKVIIQKQRTDPINTFNIVAINVYLWMIYRVAIHCSSAEATVAESMTKH